MISVGQTAPDFIAPAVEEDTAVELELFRRVEDARAVVLFVYPADFVPTCTAELCAVRDAGWHDHPEVSVVAVGGDSLFAHFAYADRFDLPFPLVSDRSGTVADSYGLLADEWEAHADIPRRATLVIDDWTVRFREVTRDALDRPAPAPVQNATAALEAIGVDVDRPRVNYEGPW